MLVDIKLNGKSVKADITADMTLYEFERAWLLQRKMWL